MTVEGAASVQHSADKTSYVATTNGSGYSTNDLIDHFTLVDLGTGLVLSSFWINVTSGAKISAPPNTDIAVYGATSGGATAANQTSSNTKLDQLHTDLGSVATTAKQDTGNTSVASIDAGIGGSAAAVAGDTGASTVSGFLRYLRDRLFSTAAYLSPNGKKVATGTTLDSLFSDDFGGNAVNAANWDVLDGGLGANVNLGSGVLTQSAIGSGTAGMTDSVAASGLTVNMNTASGAERWYLSKQVFAGKEDILVILSKSQALAANSIFIGLAEVDPTTLVPLLNPNFVGEFTNRGGCEFALSSGAQAFTAEAIADSSAAKAAVQGTTITLMTVTSEFLIEIDSRDIIVSNSGVDSTAGKGVNACRISTQCPNDKKLYKLVMRFKNVSAPGSNTTVVIQRILVVDNYEQRVQISSAEGDQIGAKALAVNVANSVVLGAGASQTQTLGVVGLQNNLAYGAATFHKLTAAATTNATSVKTTKASLTGGYIRNRAAYEVYLKFYNKGSAPVVGTDTPIMAIGIPANDKVYIADIVGAVGMNLSTGLAYAITKAYADADTTALVAGDADVNLIYT